MKNKLTMLLAATISLFAILPATADIRAITPTAWENGKPDSWQMKRHEGKLKEIGTTGAPVVFIGDSITHGWETSGKEVWAKHFADGPRRAINLGYGADRTEHVLWRITEGRELDGYEAKCIVLMIGTNNTGHFPFDKEPPVDTYFGVREILRVIAEKQPKARTILMAIFPRGPAADDPLRKRNNTVNDELEKLADGKRVIWCDISQKFLSPDGTLGKDLFPDLLHPNATGYNIWADNIVPLIDKVLSARAEEKIAPLVPAKAKKAPSATAIPVAARPSAWFKGSKWWPVRCLEKRNEIVTNSDAEYDIVMVGDSITHRWERKGGEGRALCAELKKRYSILNLGYGGDRTQHVIWRLENGELEGYKAKLFTVMIGTNNPDKNPANVAAGVKRILELIAEKHPESKIVLMPIFPRGANKDGRNERNKKVNALIKEYADGERIMWLDFNDKFLTDGVLTKKVMNDLLHPNENGYRIWLDAISPLFREVLGK